MELDDMRLAWHTLAAKFEHQQALNMQLFRESRLDKLRRSLRPLQWGQWLQLTIGVALAICGGLLWTTHLQRTEVLVCGLVAHAYGVLLIVFAARNLYLLHRIDYSAPVLDLQRRVAGLRAFRVRVEAPINAVLGCFTWIPVLWASLAVYGIDLWSPDFIRWGVATGLVGLMSVVAVAWTMRRMGLGGKIEDHSAGRSVVKAQAVLDEIARFERE